MIYSPPRDGYGLRNIPYKKRYLHYELDEPKPEKKKNKIKRTRGNEKVGLMMT